LGLKTETHLCTALGSLLFALAITWAGPTLAQESEADLQALVDAAQERGRAQEAGLADWTAQIQERGSAYQAQAQAIEAQTGSRVAQGLGMMDDPTLRAAGRSFGQPAPAQGAIYIAVSLSMPPETLRALAADARKVGAKLVIRGLVDGSFKATFAKAREVFNENSAAGLAIDPQVFRAFQVKGAPTFIVARTPVDPCGGLTCVSAAPAHDMIAGNISLAAALRQLSSSGDQAVEISSTALSRLGD
jgi:conjugal transfer pilus assembly protein TrbC